MMPPPPPPFVNYGYQNQQQRNFRKGKQEKRFGRPDYYERKEKNWTKQSKDEEVAPAPAPKAEEIKRIRLNSENFPSLPTQEATEAEKKIEEEVKTAETIQTYN